MLTNKLFVIVLLSIFVSGCEYGLNVQSPTYAPSDKTCGKNNRGSITVFADKVKIKCKNGQTFTFVPRKGNR